jgi:hypothetical protein
VDGLDLLDRLDLDDDALHHEVDPVAALERPAPVIQLDRHLAAKFQTSQLQLLGHARLIGRL